MKTIIALGLFAAALAVPIARAQMSDFDHINVEDLKPSPAPNAQHQHAAPPAQDAPAASGEKSAHAHGGTKLDAMQKNMKRLQAVMAQLRQATDPGVRKQLLEEHMRGMLQQIRLMRAAAAAPNMAMMESGSTAAESAKAPGEAGQHQHAAEPSAPGDQGGAGKTGGGKMMGGGMMKMHEQVQQRLDMIEQLLEQMLEHGAAEQ